MKTQAPGFNVQATSKGEERNNRARWGYFNNRPEDACVSDADGDLDAAVGLGLQGEDDVFGVGAGYTTYYVSPATPSSSRRPGCGSPTPRRAPTSTASPR